MGIVLVHGGTFAGSCWDPLLPHLQAPAVAVDLPGRGSRPGDVDTITLADFTEAVVSEIDAAGWDRTLLVGHSMAGLTLPRVAAERAGDLAGIVFVSCAVPEHGQTAAEATDPGIREDAEQSADAAAPDGEPAVPGDDFFRRMFGNDLDDEQFAYMLGLMVPEAFGVLQEPTDLSGLEHPIPRFWVRLTLDGIIPPAQQDVNLTHVGGAEVIELEAGHMAMIGRPAELAAILDDIAERVGAA